MSDNQQVNTSRTIEKVHIHLSKRKWISVTCERVPAWLSVGVFYILIDSESWTHYNHLLGIQLFGGKGALLIFGGSEVRQSIERLQNFYQLQHNRSDL